MENNQQFPASELASRRIDARAAGVRTAEDAANYAMRACTPLIGIFLDPNSFSNAEILEEALPPGIFRAVIKEEWGDFVEQ
ncbi:hypothetical protein N2603_30410 [Bradyrhizobium huanghuaihaiense]|uniref:hypothetical protein n=1 Tax=Bradyrhizobium huanghuaihaiense TaxID=990078 RepID=UPI0021AA54CD|nr:hypothetical protein [Bradyrhizobium sp. CB3035]UWU74351.1 hypothetical protein N2603_30410 [Bradyrhizobium sp. CB3035]